MNDKLWQKTNVTHRIHTKNTVILYGVVGITSYVEGKMASPTSWHDQHNPVQNVLFYKFLDLLKR